MVRDGSLDEVQYAWTSFLRDSGLIKPKSSSLPDKQPETNSEDSTTGTNGGSDHASDHASDNGAENEAETEKPQVTSNVTHNQPKHFTREEDSKIQEHTKQICDQFLISESELIDKLWNGQHSTPVKREFWKKLKLPNRSFFSLHKHVKRIHARHVGNGKWSPEKDEALRQLVGELGASNWKLVGSHMNKPADACRDRWRNYLVCGTHRNSQAWNAEETALLRSIVESFSTNDGDKQPLNWGEVSARMGHKRSRIQCRYKWNKIRGDIHTSNGGGGTSNDNDREKEGDGGGV